jgi:hypothetical protein
MRVPLSPRFGAWALSLGLSGQRASNAWFQLGTPLEVYLQSLKKLQQRDGEFDRIMPGHGLPLPKSFVGQQITCVENILDGTCKGGPYGSFAGEALVCK